MAADVREFDTNRASAYDCASALANVAGALAYEGYFGAGRHTIDRGAEE